MAQPNSKNIINILIGAMVILAAGLTYFYFNKQNTSSDIVLVETGAPTIVTTTVNVSPKVQQIIGLVNEINAIKLERGILSQGAYEALVNYRTATTTEATSTPNPFQGKKP